MRFIATLILFSIFSTSTQAQDQPTLYPIWWSDRLGLASLDDIDAELDRPFAEELRFRAVSRKYWAAKDFDWLETNEQSAHRTAELLPGQIAIESCRDLVEQVHGDIGPERSPDYFRYLESEQRCHFLIGLEYATLASKSFVADFAVGRQIREHLSIMAAPDWSCREINRVLSANVAGAAWEDVDILTGRDGNTVTEFVVGNGEEGHLIEHWYGDLDRLTPIVVDKYRYRVQARGDFNYDGLEDIVLSIETAYDLGDRWRGDSRYFDFSRLIAFSRANDQDVLRAVRLFGPYRSPSNNCERQSRIMQLPNVVQ